LSIGFKYFSKICISPPRFKQFPSRGDNKYVFPTQGLNLTHESLCKPQGEGKGRKKRLWSPPPLSSIRSGGEFQMFFPALSLPLGVFPSNAGQLWPTKRKGKPLYGGPEYRPLYPTKARKAARLLWVKFNPLYAAPYMGNTYYSLGRHFVVMRGVIPHGEGAFTPGVSCPKGSSPLSEQGKHGPPWHKGWLTQPKRPGRGAMASAPRMAAQDQGINAIPGKSLIKRKKSVPPDNIAVHLARRRPLRPRRAAFEYDQQSFIPK
jgi:hypothetical protein